MNIVLYGEEKLLLAQRLEDLKKKYQSLKINNILLKCPVLTDKTGHFHLKIKL